MSNESNVNKRPDAAREEPAMMPPVDVVEDAGGITLYADLPGVPRDRLNLHVESDTLTIEGEVALDVPENMEVSHVEVGMPRYRRVFTLSKELDADKVTADFRDGILKLRIPKADHARPRKIAISVA